MTEVSVLIERDLAVKREDLSARIKHQRVDSTSVASSLTKVSPVPNEYVGDFVDQFRRELRLRTISFALSRSTPTKRIDQDLCEFGLSPGDLFDLHATFDAGHRQEAAIGAIEQERYVLLDSMSAASTTSTFANDVVPLMSRPRMSTTFSPVSSAVGANLTPPALAAVTCLHLRLDDDWFADLLGRRLRCLRVSDNRTQNGTSCAANSSLGLVLVWTTCQPARKSSIAQAAGRAGQGCRSGSVKCFLNVLTSVNDSPKGRR